MLGCKQVFKSLISSEQIHMVGFWVSNVETCGVTLNQKKKSFLVSLDPETIIQKFYTWSPILHVLFLIGC